MRTPLLLLSAALSLNSCSTSPPPRPAAAQQVSTIVRRSEVRPRIESFVDAVAQPGNQAGLARWNQPVCPQIQGLPYDEGQYAMERISEVARSSQVPLAGEHCAPNLFIFVSNKPQALLQRMADLKTQMVFGTPVLSARAQKFLDTPRPVRTWYNIVGEEAFTPAPVNVAGLIATSPVFLSVFVVIDRAQVAGMSVRQLADYVAMLSFAELNPDARVTTGDSILSLFNDPGTASHLGMTDWDRALLRSLYATEQTGQQRTELTRAMVREIVPDSLAEVTVTAPRESLSALEGKILKSEEAFYREYNKANTDKDYQVWCDFHAVTGTHIPTHECKPQFVSKATAQEAQGFLWGYPTIPAVSLIQSQMPVYHSHLRQVVEKDPKLIAALRDYYVLTKHYEKVRKDKFARSWLVLD